MILSIQGAPAGALGVDSGAPVSAGDAAGLVSQGYTFCIRWVDPAAPGPQGPSELSAAEAQGILGAGLALMVGQEVESQDGWYPSPGLGTTYGSNAVQYAQAVGMPPGASVWMALYAVSPDAAAGDVIGYCNDWCAQVLEAGFIPGVYVGEAPGLSGQALYDLAFERYWGGWGADVTIPVRGWCLVESAPSAGGTRNETAQTDGQGGTAQWLVSTSSQTLSLVVQGAPPNLNGFDADQPVSAAAAAAFVAQGNAFCIRYVGRYTMNLFDLTAAEAQAIVGAGLALMVVQHVEAGDGEGYWTPTPELGTQYGTSAAAFAAACGILPGVNVWLDLEMVAGADSGVVAAYCTNWYNAVAAQGFVPGVYVGYSPGLSGQELEDLPFQHYWAGYNVDGDSTPAAGWCLVQQPASNAGLGGITNLDDDTTQYDNEGRQVQWMTATTS